MGHFTPTGVEPKVYDDENVDFLRKQIAYSIYLLAMADILV